jgi:hypothetical protein
MLAPLRLYEWPAWPELVADIAGIRNQNAKQTKNA